MALWLSFTCHLLDNGDQAAKSKKTPRPITAFSYARPGFGRLRTHSSQQPSAPSRETEEHRGNRKAKADCVVGHEPCLSVSRFRRWRLSSNERKACRVGIVKQLGGEVYLAIFVLCFYGFLFKKISHRSPERPLRKAF